MNRASTQEQVGAWLDELASESPAPGGGAAAAVSASIGASLICMVCNLTVGKPKYLGYEGQMRAALARAEEIRRTTLHLADEDGSAFEAVIAAYKLPRTTEGEKAARSEAIQRATLTAAMVPLRTAELAAEVIRIAGEILKGANKSIISDVAVAAQTARSALDASVVNVEINLASIADAERRRSISVELERHRAMLAEADSVVSAVRARIV